MTRVEEDIINLRQELHNLYRQLHGRVQSLERYSHPPQEIKPRIEAVLRDRGLIE